MKSEGPAKEAALNTLYVCLDASLKMLSPTMPYLTEELYQRLPHIPGQAAESICIAPFPQSCISFEASFFKPVQNGIYLLDASLKQPLSDQEEIFEVHPYKVFKTVHELNHL